MGGYVTAYENGFVFATVRGAGHMVPTYKPAPALALFSAWLAGEPLPGYNASCPRPGAPAGRA
jgi:serine carboxypeptidase-like clade 2